MSIRGHREGRFESYWVQRVIGGPFGLEWVRKVLMGHFLSFEVQWKVGELFWVKMGKRGCCGGRFGPFWVQRVIGGCFGLEWVQTVLMGGFGSFEVQWKVGGVVLGQNGYKRLLWRLFWANLGNKGSLVVVSGWNGYEASSWVIFGLFRNSWLKEGGGGWSSKA
jgi:hypothetical protein